MLNRQTRYYLLIAGYTLVLSYLSLCEYIKVASPLFPTWAAWHDIHMNNLAHAPYQYRVLSYAIPEVLRTLFKLDTAVAYLVQRFVFLFLALYVFHILAKKWFDDLTCVLAALTFILLYNLATLPHFQPSEEINLFVFAVGIYAIRDDKFPLLWGVVTIGAMNKSTPVFLIAFFFIYHVWRARDFRSRQMVFFRAALLTLSFFAVYLGIRFALGTDRTYHGGLWQWKYNLDGLHHSAMRFSLFVFPSILPALIILADWKHQPLFTRSFVPVVFLFTIGHFLISRLEEFRTYMPLAFVTIPAMLMLAARKANRPAGP